ncbi:cobalt-precorrin 5A hydrolase [Calderihabitans maritimus]|uniref:Cobalamin (Vitamin B12) biosynthesis protein CbiG n=1 Tax=Calderihabitans maritimus TaxID=1246530 RepID=A0A1Z5HPT7_9FIRM|nr:cobalt-precorrin 5A hydrolase [Calderihabitans maritimus]GAW91524.1 cobalamin (vitamin B12) biosynthesis protein CbiG [Calderihabitans maritimus]
MKVAIIAVTEEGARLGEKLRSGLPGERVLYLSSKINNAEIAAEVFNLPLSHLVGKLIKNFDGIVFIMALGIAVRVIAPYIQSKIQDPAIVVVDEKGRYAISTLGGHWAGANELTRQVADILGAKPVITTATDIQGLPAIDVIARRLHSIPEPFHAVKDVNMALLRQEKVEIFSEIPREEIKAQWTDPKGQLIWKDIGDYTGASKHIAVVLSSRLFPQEMKPTLFLRPRNLVVGLGCRRGVTVDEIKTAVEETFRQERLSTLSIAAFSTIDRKKDESALLQLAKAWEISVRFWSPAELARVIEEFPELNWSPRVKEKVGVGGICEPAAILGSGRGSLVVRKRKYQRVTLAVARARSL